MKTLTVSVKAAPTKMPGTSYSFWTSNEILRSRKDRYNCSWGWKPSKVEKEVRYYTERLTVPRALLLGMSDASATSTMNLFDTIGKFVTRPTLDKDVLAAKVDVTPKSAKERATFMAGKG